MLQFLLNIDQMLIYQINSLIIIIIMLIFVIIALFLLGISFFKENIIIIINKQLHIAIIVIAKLEFIIQKLINVAIIILILKSYH